MNLAHFFVELIHIFVLVVLSLELGIGRLVLVAGESIVGLLNVLHGACHSVFAVELLAVELVRLNCAGDEGLKLRILQVLNHIALQLFPLSLCLCHLLFVSAILGGVVKEVVELGWRFYTHLTSKLKHHHIGVLACHCFGDFGVRNVDTHTVEFLFEQALRNHLLNHLLLNQGCVDSLSLVLKLLAGFLILFLEFHGVDFVAIHLSNCVATAKQCTYHLFGVTKDEGKKCHTDDNCQKDGFFSDFL